MSYQISYPDSFIRELGSVPKKIRESFLKTVLPLLRETPREPSTKLKKLAGYENFWRCRVGKDYRLIYHVDEAAHEVTLLMLGHRDVVYDRAHYDPENGPTSRAVLEVPKELEKMPSAEDTGKAAMEVAAGADVEVHTPDRPLPRPLDLELLQEWEVPQRYWRQLAACRTEADLLAVAGNPTPDHVVERVMNGLWPRTIEQVMNRPARIPPTTEHVEKAVEGEVRLETFLLKLDEVQRPFVNRFRSPEPKGPWLLKGGPGSGKSTIALYCIGELLKGADELLEQPRLKVLFATYTNSLKRASSHLLQCLAVDSRRHKLEVSTVDSLARQAAFPVRSRSVPKTISGKELKKRLDHIVRDMANQDRQFPFKSRDVDFLLEEIEWVILGRGLKSQGEYSEADRTGRGRVLGKRQREQIWLLFTKLRADLKERNLVLFQQIVNEALKRAKPSFDYVFIDEAQDLTPAAIRFCTSLCKDPRKIFLTADLNQSIYGAGMSWKTVSEELDFTGRARILKRNYRSTTQIWQGIQQITQPLVEPDHETLDEETVFEGLYPKLAHYKDSSDEARRINEFLHSSLIAERASVDCAAVLCPTNKHAEYLASKLDSRLKPRYMKTNEVNLSHPGVKVLTIHAAKGLEFPVVAVTRVNKNRLPLPPRPGIDSDEHEQLQRRLFFVACSRAMRHLMVLTRSGKESPFIGGLTEDYWEIDGVV